MKKLTLKLSEVDEKLLEELKFATGFDEQMLLKIGLRMFYTKELPAYKKKMMEKEAPKGSPEEECEKLGGELFVDEQGRNACRITKGGMTYTQILK